MKKLIIFGNTIVAQLAHFYFTRDSKYEVVAFTVDESYKTSDFYLEKPLVSFKTMTAIYPPDEFELFIAIGPSAMNTFRENKVREAKSMGYRLATHISQYSICHSPVGPNSLVADGVIINPFAQIGENNFFWEHSLITNESFIGDHCYFSPKSVVSSFCKIENNCVVGTSSVIKARVRLAEKTLVGASCYIANDTDFKGVYGRKSTELLGCISDKIDISK